MAKTDLEKAIDKQIKANKENARIEQRTQYASEVINSQPILAGMRIMDNDSEEVLEAILNQYDGNEDNHINFIENSLPRPLAESIALQYTKLKMYGMISSIQAYWGGAIITLSNTAFTYKDRKLKALLEDEAEKTAHKKIETDFLKIQNMNIEQLREIYYQTILMNNNLENSIELQKKQLDVLESIFVSNEDGVDVQKELLKLMIEQEEENHPIRALLADKGADIGVAAITATWPIFLKTIKIWLASKGLLLP